MYNMYVHIIFWYIESIDALRFVSNNECDSQEKMLKLEPKK